MPLETATYISDLVTSNPAASDPLSGADDHLRLIKATAKATFGHSGQLTNSDNQLIPAAGTLAKPAYSFAAEPTLGFYRASAGIVALTGGQLRGGVPTGAVNMFIALPSSIGFATADTGKEYLELNGATYNTADYPALAAFLGAVGSTFTLPDMTTANRFPRARGSTLTVRTTQANTVGPHTHPDVTSAAETQEHTHSFSGTTGTSNQSLNHSHTYIDASVPGPQKPNSGGTAPFGSTQAGTTSAVDLSGHNHNFSGTTSGRSAVHNHVVSTPANTGTTETRPEAIAFVFAVKT